MFDDGLPEHLRGKRPRDMSREEKKEYNNHRRKISRMKETEEEKGSEQENKTREIKKGKTKEASY
jgi:uncharacterized protein (DUF2225 family)